MKKIIIFILTFIIVLLIYILFNNKKNYNIFIGDNILYNIDNESINFCNNNDYRVMDLINDINNNKKITYHNKEYTIQNLLIKSDKLIISIGINDLIYIKNINTYKYDYIDQLLEDIDTLFDLIRKYNKEKIYILNYYDVLDEQYIIYTNKRLKEIANDYDISLIDINALKINSVYPKDYKLIEKQINNSLLNK